ncbi:hypothetical protein [Bathymodiolus japonicus methanotrophic gill symbiont]|uniref:hypothetical protein n=1 Tax=Bathymodiolus japonicus methanotrophic gill symbiont TaxID=113269 RepID=UPI001C8D55A4|nr:hypothetical protein [Bathymodiolus japonicus methanotrophic gill symbiont]
MGDALNALRPQRLRTKAASSLLPHWLDGYSECNSCSSRVLLAHVESANCPVAYQGLKITTSLSSVSMIFSEGNNSSQKHLYVYDKAVTDFVWWDRQKRHANYMISMLKENSIATLVESIPFDSQHEINTGLKHTVCTKTGASNLTWWITVIQKPENFTGL